MVYALQYGFIIDEAFISIKFDAKIDQKYGIIQYVMVGVHNHDVLINMSCLFLLYNHVVMDSANKNTTLIASNNCKACEPFMAFMKITDCLRKPEETTVAY